MKIRVKFKFPGKNKNYLLSSHKDNLSVSNLRHIIHCSSLTIKTIIWLINAKVPKLVINFVEEDNTFSSNLPFNFRSAE